MSARIIPFPPGRIVRDPKAIERERRFAEIARLFAEAEPVQRPRPVR